MERKKSKHYIILNAVLKILLYLFLLSNFENISAQNMLTKDSLIHITGGIYIGQSLDSIANKVAITDNDKQIQDKLIPYKAAYRLTNSDDTIYFNVSDSNRVSSIIIYSKNADSIEAHFKAQYGAYHSKVGMSIGNIGVTGSARGWSSDKISIMFSTNFFGESKIVIYDLAVGKDFIMDYKKNKWYREDEE